MREVVIVEGVRTAIAKAGKNSWFSNVRVEDFGVACLKELVRRTGVNPSDVDDVVWAATPFLKADENNFIITSRREKWKIKKQESLWQGLE